MAHKIRLAGIAQQSTVNGAGLRKVYFSQGCQHHCKNCFNSETWPFTGGQLFDIDKLMKDLAEETYLDGVTLSGGDPLEQAGPFSILARKVRKLGFNIWCYTGYTWEQIVKNMKKSKTLATLIKQVDVLIDGKYVDALHSDKVKYRGSTNQRVIDVQKSLQTHTTITIEYQ